MRSFEQNLFDLLLRSSLKYPNNTAIVEGSIQTTYMELIAIAEQCAAHLVKLGVRAGDRVVISTAKSLAEVALIFAISRIGAVLIDVGVQIKPPELAEICQWTSARLLCMDQARTEHVGNVVDGIERWIVPAAEISRHCAVFPWSREAASQFVDRAAKYVPAYNDTAAIIFTSGTTGGPKGVVHTNLSLLTSTHSTSSYLGLGAADKVLNGLSFSYVYGFGQLLCVVEKGGSIVLQQPAPGDEVLAALKHHRITGLGTVPIIWQSITDHLNQNSAQFPSLRYLTVAGGKCTPSLTAALAQHFPAQAKFGMYGTTETIRSSFLPPHLFAALPGSIGRSVPNAELYVVNTEGRLCEVNEPGELVHRGRSMAKGYFNSDAETSKKFRACPAIGGQGSHEIVCYTGDLVRRDADGLLWYIGRNDRLVKIDGFRVNLLDVELALAKHERVLEAIAFDYPNPRGNDRVHAIVRLNDGPRISDRDLRRHCRGLVPLHSIPGTIIFWPGDFLRTHSGKTDVKTMTSLARREVDGIHAAN